jgi:hypothetical protein
LVRLAPLLFQEDRFGRFTACDESWSCHRNACAPIGAIGTRTAFESTALSDRLCLFQLPVDPAADW